MDTYGYGDVQGAFLFFSHVPQLEQVPRDKAYGKVPVIQDQKPMNRDILDFPVAASA